MLLFEHKQYLQIYDAESSMQTDIIFFFNYGSLMPTKTARWDYNELPPWFVTSQTQINPAPRNKQKSGPCIREEEELLPCCQNQECTNKCIHI